MPTIKFNVDGKEYTAQLSRTYFPYNGRDRISSTCVLITKEPMRVYSGITIKNPRDGMRDNLLYGFRLAFKRALFQMFIVETLKGGIRLDFKLAEKMWDVWKEKYRIAFGKALHEYYREAEELPF